MDNNAHDEEGNCNPGYCPIQEQCHFCEGTGDMPTVSETKDLRDEVIALREKVEERNRVLAFYKPYLIRAVCTLEGTPFCGDEVREIKSILSQLSGEKVVEG
jgi:hypothetical protein